MVYSAAGMGGPSMVARTDISEFSKRLVKEFRPAKVVLFGSHACGVPREDSDVDLLVTMDYTGNSRNVAAQMIRRLKPRFAVDIIVRSRVELRERVEQHDFFLTEALRTGQVLYEAVDARMDPQG